MQNTAPIQLFHMHKTIKHTFLWSHLIIHLGVKELWNSYNEILKRAATLWEAAA